MLQKVEKVSGKIVYVGDDEALTRALREGHRYAQEAFYNRYAKHVRGVLVRVLGTNVDVKDHLHNVFIQAFISVKSIKEGKSLKQWLTTVAVFTAIGHIKATQRKRWLVFVSPNEIPEQESEYASPEQREAVRHVYDILNQMKAEDRALFCLRVIDGMALNDLAELFDVSLATIKRRIDRAKVRFSFLMKGNPGLLEFVQSMPLPTYLKTAT